jgi:endonuclease/exonuclease/phosphatase family metal-dependent hydrolase
VFSKRPDILLLQEVEASTYERWLASLLHAGYSVTSTRDLLDVPYPPPPYPEGIKQQQISRRKFNLTAARCPLGVLPGLRFTDEAEARFSFPEKYLAVEVLVEGQLVEVHNAHLPPGSSRQVIKPQTFEAIARRLEARPSAPQILAGDFNTPASEANGKAPETWARAHPKLRERWKRAELGVLRHPRLRDAYLLDRSARHETGPFAISHYTGRTSRRYDHVYVSEHFQVDKVDYDTEVLAAGVSDHASLCVEVSLA